MSAMTSTLILLRHGESTWNALNQFTGWVDVPLSEKGTAEAIRGGTLLTDAGVLPDVLHTSLLRRAITTANLALDEADRLWVPVRRSWRLNERHYGDLQAKDKKQTVEQYGSEQVHEWRRSYDVVPPAECLLDVVNRMLPYWYDAIVPDLRAGHTVLVAAHGNSLRALVKHLDGISDDDIAELNIPTGIPLHYELGDDFAPVAARPILDRYLGDPEAIAAKAAAVAAQGKAK